MENRSRRSRSTLLRRFRADLRSDPRKKIALFGLLPLLVIAWIPVLVSGDEPTPRKKRAAATTEATAPVSSPATDATMPGAIDFELRAKLAGLMEQLEEPWSPSWNSQPGEDPFGVGSSVTAERKDPGKGKQREQALPVDETDEQQKERRLAATFAPTCTFLSTTREDVAIIGGLPYRSGDQIEQFFVGEIGARTVVLKGLFGEYEVRIPLDQEERKKE